MVIPVMKPASIACLLVTLTGCATEHTMDSTENLSDRELAALCADLNLRADLDCRWNMQEQQSAVGDQQTWEINCRTRRDSARESYDNVCHQPRARQQEDQRQNN